MRLIIEIAADAVRLGKPYLAGICAVATSLALVAAIAFVRIRKRLSVYDTDCFSVTSSNAEAAPYTLLAVELNLWIVALCLRVMTPSAVKRTAFEKYGSSDAVSVMY